MKTSALLSLVLASALATSACQRDEATAMPDPATPAPRADAAPQPSPASAPVVATPSNEPRIEGAADLAGTFEGEGVLTLAADGTYTFTLGDASDDGTWAHDDGDPKRLRFDPNSKSLQDHVLEVVSSDELRPTVADGSGMASGMPFKRVAMP